MIDQLIAELGPWSWWILGFVLLIVEIFAPGVFFLWIGLAAIVAGTIALFVPLSWQVQIIVFGVLAVVFAVLGRRLYARFGKTGDAASLNERGEQLVGRTFTLSDDLTDGEGRLKIGDTFWLVHGSDTLVAGSKVIVTGTKGTILLIEAV